LDRSPAVLRTATYPHTTDKTLFIRRAGCAT
jgi:hypothetical protein